MTIKKLALLAALSTTALVPTSSANAFGFTCIPRLQNCWCTYLRPCPVIDFGVNFNTGSTEETLKELENVVTENAKIIRKSTMALGGDIGGLIPGLNSIGLNLDNLLQSQIDEITSSITGVVDGIKEKISSINLAVQDLQGVLSGGIHPSMIADKLSEAGINALDLQSLGISQDSINGILNGNLAPKDILAVAGSLDIQGDLLKAGGITPDSLKSLAEGTLSFSDLEGQLKNAVNLNFDDLSSIGIDISSIQQLAGTFDEAALKSMIGQLDIGDFGPISDLAQLKNIISGDIGASEIFRMAGSMGIDVSQLESLGVKIDTIQAFKNGSFTADQLIEFTSAIGMGGDGLKSLGVDASTIMAIANGDLSPENLLQIAQQNGLSTDGLSLAGIDINKIASIAQSGNLSEAMQLIEQTGLARNPLAGIGISSDQLAGLIEGTITPSEIGNILAARGIDPASIILPTADGTAVNGFGEVVDNLRTTFNIPIDNVAGLRDVLERATSLADMSTFIDADSMFSELQRIAGIDLTSVDTFSDLINGNISSASLIDFLDTQGVGPEQLRQLGVTRETLDALSTGNFTSDQLLNFSRNLGVGGQALESLGIGASALQGIASGSMSPADFLQQAASLGLDSSTLTSMGLSEPALENVAAAGTPEAAQALTSTAAGAAPQDVQVPVANGSPLSTAPGATTSESGAATGTNTTGDLGESCTEGQQTLLTSDAPPNFFGDDVAQIDMAIAQGDILQFEESMADAMRLANRNQAQILARAIQVKNMIPEALDALDYYVSEVKKAKNIQEDLAANDAINTQLLMARAEITSLLTYFASSQAAAKVNPSTFSPVPTFPHDSQWEEAVTTAAEARSDEITETSGSGRDAANEYTNFSYQAQTAMDGLEALEALNGLQDTMPALVDSILHHETMKSHVFMLEGMIRQSAAQLFVPADSEAAAEQILADLRNSAGEYGPESRWQSSDRTAQSIESRALSPNSSYGQRIIVESQDPREPSRPSSPASRPYNYPTIDSVSSDDPYDIIRHAPTNVREGEQQPPPPLVGLFQYYLEAYRREAFYGDMRRGVAPNTMSLLAWQEFSNSAPQCLIGPIATTPSNLSNRPELFDLSPHCDHLTFAGGDVEDFIPSDQLGGTDSVLWESKIRSATIQMQYGTPEEIIATAEDIVSGSYTQEVIDLISSDGHPQLLEDAQDLLDNIQEGLMSFGTPQ